MPGLRYLPIACLMLMLSLSVSASSSGGKAALLKSGLPGDDPALIEKISTELLSAGYAVQTLSADEICSSETLSTSQFELLVLPNAASLPAKSTAPIDDFLRRGGDIIALNAPLWQAAYVKAGGKWITRDEFQRSRAAEVPPHMLFDFKDGDVSTWTRASNNETELSSAEVANEGPSPGTKSLDVRIPDLTSWDNYSIEVAQPFAKGHALTVFAARGDSNTTQLQVEWSESDGSRWIAVVPLHPEWRQYVLVPEDFKYWQSNPDRGGPGDCLKPENAARVSFGMAFTHMGPVPGRHEFWVANVGTAPMTPEYREILGEFSPPKLDILTPGYKFFDSTGVASLKVRGDQAILAGTALPTASVVRSPHPRPGGGGFSKGRAWRFIPLVQAETASGEWRGTPVTMLANTDGPYKGSVWASFGIGDAEWYRSPAALSLIRQIAAKMLDGEFILDAGTDFYTYLEDQRITLGANVANLGKADRTATARFTLAEAAPNTRVVKLLGLTVGSTSDSRRITTDLTVEARPGQTAGVSTAFTQDDWPRNGYIATVELLVDGKVVDKVGHEVNVWKPEKDKHFVTVKDGEFMLDGKRWRAHGVNYMPSSGIGTEDGDYFEHWIGARPYDPEIVQRDIDHMKDLGYNAVSIFVYYGQHEAQNLVDILRRLDAAGMKANVSLRPGTPMDFYWPQIGEIVQDLHLKDNDTVFAYDLAWEPMFNHHTDRVIWDREWEKWIVERYGSVESAESDWGFRVPRDETGKVTNPLPEQIDTDGEWRVMVAAYRRFLDTLLYKKYGEARRLVRSVDPYHLVSFRMAEAANPTYHWDGRIPYDFPYLAGAVDFLAPEAYGRISDSWDRVKPGWFQFEYARYADPMKPMIWAEQGVSAWDNARMSNTQDKLDYQAKFYDLWYQMLIKSGADGIFSWYYPGGFRVGENSDYGVINPDGSDKPVSRVIRRYADQYINGPSSKPIDHWITIDRDEHPDGPAGIYDEVGRRFWAAIDQGLAPGLESAGKGTDSSNCALVAVGNVPCNGSNPPKYLDAAFDVVEVQDAEGKWVRVQKGDTVKVPAGKPVKARATFTNLGEAKMLSAKILKGNGAVYVGADCGGMYFHGLVKDLGRLESVTIDDLLVADKIESPTDTTLFFSAHGRIRFGEKFTIHLDPVK